MSTFRMIALALLMAASQIVLVAHSTAHFNPDLEQCRLCVNQAQPHAALPAADSTVHLLPAAPLNTGLSPASVLPTRCVTPYLQRAPPTGSS